MRILITEKDVDNLTGKFVIQLANDQESDEVLNDKNWSFFKEKRISFINGLTWSGFFYEHRKFESKEDFVFYFNHYIDRPMNEGQPSMKDSRFHRLLTSKELEFVLNKMKQSLY